MGRFDQLKKGNQSNNNNQTQQKAPEKAPEKVENTPKEPIMSQIEGLPEEAIAMQDFIAESINGIRAWQGKDGNEYATLSLKKHSSMPKGYSSVSEVAEELTEILSDMREETGIAIFADFDVVYANGKQKAKARLLKAKVDENELIVALNVEHTVSRAKGSFSQFKPSEQKVEKSEEKVEEKVEERKFGFGR